MRRASAVRSAAASAIDWLNRRHDRSWLWPTVTLVSGVVLALCTLPDNWWARSALILAAIALGFLGQWGSARRHVTIESQLAEQDALSEQLEEKDEHLRRLRSERDVVSESLNEMRAAASKLVLRTIQRHYALAGLTYEDRITWVLVSGDHLRVVGRHCHDAAYQAIGTRRYDRNHGVMGLAANRRRTVREVFDSAAGERWENWQARDGKLGSKAAADQLTMPSCGYVVVPLSDHSALDVLGLVVLETLSSDTSRLEEVVQLLAADGVKQTVTDILSVLAQAPDIYPDTGEED
jgi:hypothetical protein